MQARPTVDPACRQAIVARRTLAKVLALLGVRARAGLGGNALVVADNRRAWADTLAVLRVTDEAIRALEGARIASFADGHRVGRIVTMLGIGRVGYLIEE